MYKTDLYTCTYFTASPAIFILHCTISWLLALYIHEEKTISNPADFRWDHKFEEKGSLWAPADPEIFKSEWSLFCVHAALCWTLYSGLAYEIIRLFKCCQVNTLAFCKSWLQCLVYSSITPFADHFEVQCLFVITIAVAKVSFKWLSCRLIQLVLHFFAMCTSAVQVWLTSCWTLKVWRESYHVCRCPYQAQGAHIFGGGQRLQ